MQTNLEISLNAIILLSHVTIVLVVPSLIHECSNGELCQTWVIVAIIVKVKG